MYTLSGRTAITFVDELGRVTTNMLTHCQGNSNENEFYFTLIGLIKMNSKILCANFRGMKVNIKKIKSIMENLPESSSEYAHKVIQDYILRKKATHDRKIDRNQNNLKNR